MRAKSTSGAALACVAVLFFAWGFVTSMIDPLVASVRAVFDLSYAEAMLTQFAWFIAYGVVSLPAAALVSSKGYTSSILIAIGAMVIGALIIPLATMLEHYPVVLFGLFVIASGVTLLQVAANPLAASMGVPERAHFRLMLTQSFNSLGTVVGPFLGSAILLSGGIFAAEAATAADRQASLRAIDVAFFGIGGLFLVLGGFVWLTRRRIDAVAKSDPPASPLRAFRSGWALFGALAIFLYVGAEVAIGSMLTAFLHQDRILGLPLEDAGKFVSIYWFGALLGRFAGIGLLTRVNPSVLLLAFAAAASALCIAVTQLDGPTAGYLALSIGFFNSIMFPSIFTLTLERSSAPAAATSGLLCMAIVGGAVLPLAAGLVIDASPLMQTAFFVPLAGYVGVAAFALFARTARPIAPSPQRASVATH
ncbi:MAG: sugar MFS transporter [Parvularculaceae bacterium]